MVRKSMLNFLKSFSDERLSECEKKKRKEKRRKEKKKGKEKEKKEWISNELNIFLNGLNIFLDFIILHLVCFTIKMVSLLQMQIYVNANIYT